MTTSLVKGGPRHAAADDPTVTTATPAATPPVTPPPTTPATTLPPEPASPPTVEVRRGIRGGDRDDRLAVTGSALAAIALVWVLYYRVLPFSGLLGYVLCTYVAFLLIYVLVTVQRNGRVATIDRIMGVLFRSAGAVVAGALILVVCYTAYRGFPAVIRWSFFSQDMRFAGPLDPITVGGVLHGVVGTLQQIGIATVITVPLGIATAVYLNEVRGRFSQILRIVVEAMTAVPSVIAGLFVFATVILTFGVGKSGIAAALALSVEMLPIIARASEVVLRLVPNGLREASLALGSPQWRTVWQVVLPTARPGLVTATLLGVARAIGETAPVLLTAGFATALNLSPLTGPQPSLPLLAFDFVRSPEPVMVTRGFGAALTLLVVVLVLFVVARLTAGRQARR